MTTEEQTIFLNGYVVGKLAKGSMAVYRYIDRPSSGSGYNPKLWSDENEFDHFYIDFKKELEDLNAGIFNASILLYSDGDILRVHEIEHVSAGIYKILVDIRGRVNGVMVTNLETSLLYFKDTTMVPTFSASLYLAGIPKALRVKYIYDKIYDEPFKGSTMEQPNFILDYAVNITHPLETEVVGNILTPQGVSFDQCLIELI